MRSTQSVKKPSPNPSPIAMGEGRCGLDCGSYWQRSGDLSIRSLRAAMAKDLRQVVNLKFEGAFGQAGEKRPGLERREGPYDH
jgi:hypothetical protein